MQNGQFSEELFSSLLDLALARGYHFSSFLTDPTDRPTLYLRHDVDISPTNALKLGIIAAGKGLKSNLFFQLNAETYNIFSPSVVSAIAELREMGHCVGLHIDQLILGEDEVGIRETIDWFSRRITPIDRVVSFHRPTPTVLGRRYDAFINAYDSKFFRTDSYLSDSRRSLAFLSPFEAWLEEGRPLIQLLLHPEWWSTLEDIEAIWTELRARRQGEIAHYVRTNFPKVFADVIAVEGRDFRI